MNEKRYSTTMDFRPGAPEFVSWEEAAASIAADPYAGHSTYTIWEHDGERVYDVTQGEDASAGATVIVRGGDITYAMSGDIFGRVEDEEILHDGYVEQRYYFPLLTAAEAVRRVESMLHDSAYGGMGSDAA